MKPTEQQPIGHLIAPSGPVPAAFTVDAPLPCPFCGWPADRYIDEEGWRRYTCSDCSMDGPRAQDFIEALELWNRRASPDEHLLRQAAEYIEQSTEYRSGIPGWVSFAAALRQRIGGTK
jgi:hypothetical protein